MSNKRLVSWYSKKQIIVALLLTKVEFMALIFAAKKNHLDKAITNQNMFIKKKINILR